MLGKKYVSGLALVLMLSASPAFADYTVKNGDSLWKISQSTNVSIDEIIKLNNLKSDNLTVGQVLKLNDTVVKTTPVVAPVTKIKTPSSPELSWLPLTVAKTPATTMENKAVKQEGTAISTGIGTYVVKSGDTLGNIASQFYTTVETLQKNNNLTNYLIYPGQTLKVGSTVSRGNVTRPDVSVEILDKTKKEMVSVEVWPSETYVVQDGDTLLSIANKFGITLADIRKYNYRESDDIIISGEKLAINGYAPRSHTVTPGTESAPKKLGAPVEWFTEGKYILRPRTQFIITDTETGKQMNFRVFGGVNHADVETLTEQDTQLMKSLFGEWTWTPRPVTVYVNGMNIAASLSGMPHTTLEDIKDNGVTGHYDLYLTGSIPHGSGTSKVYVQQHYDAIKKATK